MPNKPNVKDLLGKTFGDAEHAGPEQKPLRAVLKDENAARVLLVPIDHIEPNADQPRKNFKPTALQELADSIREHGVLQPIIVHQRPDDPERCIIIAGERRWRAAKLAGRVEMPVLVRTPEDAREVAIIENLQRENLNPIEEAEALLALKKERGYTDAQLARIVGKSRSSITESLSLTQLPEAIKAQCRTSDIASKSQLLQVLRAGSTDKVEAAFHAVETGAVSTVRELRSETVKAKPKMGRPKHARFAYEPDNGKYAVTVTFPKKHASRDDLREALRAAMKHVPEMHAS